MAPVIPKTYTTGRGAKVEIRRNAKAWRALRGIWKGKKLVNPVKWQRKIRKESAR